MATLDTRNFTRSRPPAFPYAKALVVALPGWDISLVFTGRVRARSLNQRLRNKDYVPNVLSYATGRKSGEIIICLDEARRQAPSYDLSYAVFVGFLFIHGCFHLAGKRHGTTMERQERALLARLVRTPKKTTHGTTHSHRN